MQYIGNGHLSGFLVYKTARKVYTLKINAEGQQYTAQSILPQPVDFEGLDQDSFTVGGETSYTFCRSLQILLL